MKKIFSLIVVFLVTFLVGCSSNNASTNTNQPVEDKVVLSKDQSLVLSTYLASNLLSSTSNTQNLGNESNFGVQFLSSTEELEIESELDEVNVYFDKLKVFMDGGVESVLAVTEQPSTVTGYDHEISYTIEGVSYVIYYSYVTVEETPTEETEVITPVSNDLTTDETDEVEEENGDEIVEEDDNDEEEREEEFEIRGLMIIDGIEYQLTGANKYEGSEQKMYFETIDTNNTNNYVKVEIKNEEETQKFRIITIIDGVEKRSEIKFVNEDNETKVDLKLIDGEQESEYSFKKEVEENKTVYKLKYEINGVKGEVRIIETTDELGNPVYEYEVRESGKDKKIEKENRDRGRDNDERGNPGNDHEDDVEETEEQETEDSQETDIVEGTDEI